jgi:hypothetical protein
MSRNCLLVVEWFATARAILSLSGMILALILIVDPMFFGFRKICSIIWLSQNFCCNPIIYSKFVTTYSESSVQCHRYVQERERERERETCFELNVYDRQCRLMMFRGRVTIILYAIWIYINTCPIQSNLPENGRMIM